MRELNELEMNTVSGACLTLDLVETYPINDQPKIVNPIALPDFCSFLDNLDCNISINTADPALDISIKPIGIHVSLFK